MFRVIIFLLISCLSHVTYGNIIRDSEIEEAVNLTIEPLRKASGINDLKIYIIDDPEPNAFTAGGNQIYVHSGLIIDFPDPDVLRGIVAHELGHILGKHVMRREEVIQEYNKAFIASTALGLAAALGNDPSMGLAIAISGLHFSDRSIKAYSRSLEASADQTALKILEKSGYSAGGMISFFEKMKLNSKEFLANPYDQTHPLTNDRLLILQSFTKRSKSMTKQTSAGLRYKFARSSAKLQAYTTSASEGEEAKYKENKEEIAHYIKAIRCFRIGQFDDALNHINKLLMVKPNDPFYHELKGQILFEAGKTMALTQYNTAVNLRPNDALIRLGKAIIGITTFQDNPYKINDYYDDLLFVIKKEPDNLLARFYLAILYEKKGLKGKSYLNSAIIAYKIGNKQNAKTLAAEAMKELPTRSTDWYGAYDIFEDSK